MQTAADLHLAKVAASARTKIEAAQFRQAEALVRQELKGTEIQPRHAELLYLLAVACRYDKRPKEAVQTLQQLVQLDPQLSRTWQELGHAGLACNQADLACRGYAEAVRLNPALLASWTALAGLYRRKGLREAAARAEKQAAWLKSLPAPLLRVLSLMHQNRLRDADRECRRFLQQNKQHLEGMRLLAGIAEKLGIFPEAEFLLETALALEPEHMGAGEDYANLLLKMQKFGRALQQAEKLTDLQPENPVYLSLLGNALAGAGRHAEAIRIYDRIIGAHRGQHKLHVMRGHAQKTLGQLPAAIKSYQAAFAMQPDYGDAFWSLANTKTYSFTEDELTLMQEALAGQNTGREDRVHLHFALGRAFEDQQAYPEAFRHYADGNRLQATALPWSQAGFAGRIEAQINTLTPELLAKRHSAAAKAGDPIFIVGLPRAGSTLLEQILASHSQVDGTLELPHINALAQRLKERQHGASAGEWRRYPEILPHLDDSYFARFAEQFLQETRIYRGTAPYFTDKNPNNFLHAGLIKLILPNAKIIDARRHPMACCFSGFKQLFGQGQAFTYGLDRMGHYYSCYLRLMDHWNRVLPGEILLVEHEKVVQDLEGEVRRLLDFCELPFEPGCLDFHKTRRSIRTPSSEQVRQPLYDAGLNAWKPFAPWLQPLADALGTEVRKKYRIADRLC